ncbi:hypothetical protein [Actinomyces urogenitalis]|uniref:hypothetical protein n=1 Tax=Actinomyces urogenitalis TaxID=103621 RepID=UPI00254EFAAB|nr:hypothetical protein [Actinomyces urogenitalis]MDK8237428.1 hypothetical protein [Actinomyces urogenitalis]MDU5427468.1 hypothetical protein [Actinomyces urogenitalis]WOO94225.1 hypothetical protein R3I39_05760 [Actinomyces urogenitalis]
MTSIILPLISVSPAAPPGVAEKVSTVLNYLAWAAGAVCVAAIILGGIIILLGATGRAGDGAERVVRVIGFVLIGAALASGASALGSALMGV